MGMIPKPLASSLALGLALVLPPMAGAAERIDFNRDIRPILSNSCFKCHGPSTKKGGLRLDLRDAALKKEALVPGKPDESELLRRVLADDSERMPPADAAERLPAAQVAKLRAWIEQGAEWAPHWAFVKPQAALLPAVQDRSWPRSPIDYFVLAKLEAAGLKPSPEADRTTLIRRVTLDLTGLLPTPQEVEAFLKDNSPDAYEKVVDRLLNSPHYGERQARHWLDMARYADSNGYTIDGQRSVWPYRDWVIAAYNADMPFDRFTTEQLAGDLLPNPTREQLIATGFHRNTPFNEEGGTDREQFRAERTIDRTNTTGAVWLGLTVGCAQCHNHKYDPLTQKEYYRFYAFFNTADEPVLRLGSAEQEAKLKDLQAQLAKARKESKGKDSPEVKKLQKQVRDCGARIPSTLIVRETASKRPTHVHERGDFLRPGEPVTPGYPEAMQAGLANSQTKAHGPRPVGLNRLDLARWLVSPDNPLTPRVVVNRMWQHHFGKGLVETENDFGMQGTPPTHPELLDWLAVEFVRGGWGMKRLHKLIVMSATYRQSSRMRSAECGVRNEEVALAGASGWLGVFAIRNPQSAIRNRSTPHSVDPNNQLLGRQARLRLEAEIIRDAALSASGLLSRKVGGPGVYPPQSPEVFSFTQGRKPWPESKGPDRYRRGMYTFIWRQSQHPLLTTFDAADAQTACTRRNRSNTPLQALHLANDPAFVEIAEGLGKRVVAEGPADDAGRIDFAFRLCFARTPTPAERSRLLQYLDACRRAKPDTAWTMLARVLLNLDEFVTRE